jgi:hypothetical protein
VAIAIVAGAIANKPLSGGEAWVRLSWVLGLRRLGFEVYFLERLRAGGEAAAPQSVSTAPPSRRGAALSPSTRQAHLESVLDEFELRASAALLSDDGASLLGIDARTIATIAEEAEVLFDLSGHLGDLQIASRARRRVYVDLDPGFTQAWHLDPSLDFSLDGYDDYVTVGLNVGSDGCSIPSCGIEWVHTLPPIVLELWRRQARPASKKAGPPETRPAFRPAPAPARADEQADLPRFTTVSTWRTPHGAVAVDGRMPGLKHHEMRRLIELPRRVEGATFELALDIDPGDAADLSALQDHGWWVTGARDVAATPSAFRAYVQGSFAELSVAQPVYTQSASGWFSDRTGAYLAAGRPAVIQDTGIASRLPIGEGILTFGSLAQAAEAARRVLEDPGGHSQAAADFAAAHLDSDLVLGRLLEALRVG